MTWKMAENAIQQGYAGAYWELGAPGFT